jgi:hypothetical protein
MSRAKRLDADWTPSAEFIEAARDIGFTDKLEILRMAEAMRDWSAADQRGAKLDWLATWRNWCRREADRKGIRPAPKGDLLANANPSKSWRQATGHVGDMLKALHDAGVPPEVLDRLHSAGIGVTRVNCPALPPAAVYADHRVCELWDSAVKPHAEKAGYHWQAYSKAYVMERRAKKAATQ